MNGPYGVCCDTLTFAGKLGPIIMTCEYSGAVKLLDYEGNVLQTHGTAGSGPKQLFNPWGVTTDPAGRILVCDQSNYRVMSIDGDSWVLL